MLQEVSQEIQGVLFLPFDGRFVQEGTQGADPGETWEKEGGLEVVRVSATIGAPRCRAVSA